MFTQKMAEAFNEQLNKEYYSAYLYASMEAWFAKEGLDGFSKWMKAQSKEELEHARKLYDYILKREGIVKLAAIEAPQTEWQSLLDVFEKTLEHEKYVTSQVTKLYEVAKEENDIAAQIFLQWFITEQVEEEESVRKVLDRIKLTKCTGDAIFHLDTEFGGRESE